MNVSKFIILSMLVMSVLATSALAAPAAHVIMTFDDGWNTTSQNVYPILQANGQQGVVFLITDPAYRTYPAYMTLANLNTLQIAGWDISSHTVSHMILTNISSQPEQLKTELLGSRQWLVSNGFGQGSWFFAYPEGIYDNAAEASVQSYGYIAARSVDSVNGTTYQQYTKIDPTNAEFAMKAFEPDCSDLSLMTCTSADIIQQINNTIGQNGLLIIAFHKVVPQYDSNVNNRSTEFLASDLLNVSNYLYENNASVDVETLSQYFGTTAPPYIPPAVPTGLTATSGANWIKLNWTAGDVATAAYTIIINGTIRATSTTNTSYNITPAVVGTNYYVKVYSVASDTISLSQTPAEMNVTITGYIPQTPINVTTAFVTNNTIGLNWSEGTGGNLTDYYRIFVNGTWISNMTTSTNITFNATPGLNYGIEIFAVNATNIVTQNITSAKYNASIPIYIPSTPTNVTTAFVTNTTIGLNWSEGTGGNITDYYRVIVNGSWLPNVISPNISFNATPGLIYPVEIYAVNSTYAVTLNLTPAKYNASIPIYVPSSPTGLTETINGTDPIALNWTEGTGGNKTDYYMVYINHTWYQNMTGLNTTFNATPGIDYPIEVYAVNTTHAVTINWVSANIIALIPLYMPESPDWVIDDQGNFWVTVQWKKNQTEQNNTDVFNYSVDNGTGIVWTNLSTNTNITVTTVPHGNVTVIVYSVNLTDGGVQNPYPLIMNWTMWNNPVSIVDGVWADYDLYVGDTLTITPIIDNVDNDTLTYTTNASLNYSNVTINTSTGVLVISPAGGDQGLYHWIIYVQKNITGGINQTLYFNVSITTKPLYGNGGGGGGNGGGGGGSGGVSGYDPNADKFERRDSQIKNKVESTVAFTNNPLISGVSFYGIRNYGDVTVAASILKGNPEWQNVTDIYKYFSVTLDTIRQPTEYLYIANASVDIFINNSNLGGNTLKAYRFYNGTYNPINATILKIDTNRTYFRLNSSGLSNFAIALEPKYILTPTPIVVVASVASNKVEQVSQTIQQTKETLYRLIIKLIKKYMFWV